MKTSLTNFFVSLIVIATGAVSQALLTFMVFRMSLEWQTWQWHALQISSIVQFAIGFAIYFVRFTNEYYRHNIYGIVSRAILPFAVAGVVYVITLEILGALP